MVDRRRRSAVGIVVGVVILVFGMVLFRAEAQLPEPAPQADPGNSIDDEMREAFKALENLPAEMEALSKRIREGTDPMLRDMKAWLEQTSQKLTDAGRKVREETEAAEAEGPLHIVHLEHTDPQQMADMLKSLSLAYQVTLYPRQETGDLLVVGPPEAVRDLERQVRRLDQPATNAPASGPGEVEVVVQVLRGGDEADGAIPAPLAPIVADLLQRFPHPQYELAATAVLRTALGTPGETKGIMESRAVPGLAPMPVWQQIGLTPQSFDQDTAVLTVNPFQYTLETPYLSARQTEDKGLVRVPEWRETGLSTSLTLVEGVPKLVGSVMAGESDATLYVVATARRVVISD